MISTRRAINPQAQAMTGQTSRYETPVSAFTTMSAIPSVASMNRPQQTTPTMAEPPQPPQVTQPVEAPSTLAAIASGIGGGLSEAPEVGGYTPANDFERALDAMAFGDPTAPMKDAVVRGLVSAAMPAVLGAPADMVAQIGIGGMVPGMGTIAKTVSDLAIGAMAKGPVKEAYGPVMDDFSLSDYADFQDTKDFAKTADEMAIDDSVATPGSYSVRDKAQFGMYDAAMQEVADRTNVKQQVASALGLTPERKPTLFDEVVVPEELERRYMLGTSAPSDNYNDDAIASEAMQYGMEALGATPESFTKEESFLGDPGMENFMTAGLSGYAMGTPVVEDESVEKQSFWGKMASQDPSNARALLEGSPTSNFGAKREAQLREAWDSYFGNFFGDKSGNMGLDGMGPGGNEGSGSESGGFGGYGDNRGDREGGGWI